ncbi:hypothetical protein QTN25_007590 [Entamoeba marina]
MKALLLFCIILIASADDSHHDHYVTRRMDRFVHGRWFNRWSKHHRTHVRSMHHQLKKSEKLIHQLKSKILTARNNKEKAIFVKQLNKLRLQAISIQKHLIKEIHVIRRHHRKHIRRVRIAKRKTIRVIKKRLNSLLRKLKKQYVKQPKALVPAFKDKARKIFFTRRCQRFHRLCKRIYKRYIKRAYRVKHKIQKRIAFRKRVLATSQRKVLKASDKVLYHFEKNYGHMDKNHDAITRATLGQTFH